VTLLAELQRGFQTGQLAKADFIAHAGVVHQQLWGYQRLLAEEGVREIRVSARGVQFLMGEEAVWIEAPAGEPRVAPLETLNFGGAYEAAESRAMNLLASGARCVLDVGANIGIHALRLALREPQSTVHAFEPLPQSFEFLSRNIAANGLGDRVRAHGFGLSRENGSFSFHLAPENGTNASLLNVAGRADARQIVGLTLKLDDWADNTGSQPDYLKVDVEGAELWVFEGGAQTIERHRPRVFTELLRKWSAPFGYHPNDVLRFFVGLGYGCWAVSDSGVRELTEVTDETLETNYAFLHREAHRETIGLLELMGQAR
jgi:FkbM family methyltransferase